MVLIAAAITGTALYVVLLWYYIAHWKPEPIAASGYSTRPHISVVIAARNEVHTIGPCLQSLLSQTYPSSHFEIIVVDDLSTDDTSSIVQQYQGVTLLRTTPEHQGKKAAQSTGIAASDGEVIAMTDADCIVPPGWLSVIARAFDSHVQVVTGPVLSETPKTAFERFQALDLVSLAMVTASGLHSGLHHLGNGANMAVRRTALEQYHEDLSKRYASGDDLFLIQDVAVRHPGSIRYLWGDQSVVLTNVSETLQAFLDQRTRWASKNTALPERSVFRTWAFIWFVFVLNLIALIAAPFRHAAWMLFPLCCIAAILLVEFLILRPVTRYYRMTGLLSNYWISSIMHYMYVVSIGAITLFRKRYEWKGRSQR